METEWQYAPQLLIMSITAFTLFLFIICTTERLFRCLHTLSNGWPPGSNLPSSRKVNRPIWGNSLKVSRQIVPAVRKRAMQTWSCLTNRGRVLLFSPVFLSTKQIKAYKKRNNRIQRIYLRRKKNTPYSSTNCFWRQFERGWATLTESYCNLHFLNAGMNVKDCIVTWTDDGFVFNDDNLGRRDVAIRTEHIQTSLIRNACPLLMSDTEAPTALCWDGVTDNSVRTWTPNGF